VISARIELRVELAIGDGHREFLLLLSATHAEGPGPMFPTVLALTANLQGLFLPYTVLVFFRVKINEEQILSLGYWLYQLV
jgi:hypothetical protein